MDDQVYDGNNDVMGNTSHDEYMTTPLSMHDNGMSDLSIITTVDQYNSTPFEYGQNETNQTQGYQRNEDLAKVEIAVQSVILFMAIFGNGMVLIVLLALRRKKLTRMNMMIVHLSCADLFVAFFNVLPQLIWDVTHRFQGGNVLCKGVKYFQVVAMYASSYVLVSTAIDRYLAICHPLTTHTWTMRKMHMLVAVAWLLSLVFSIPQLTIFSFKEIQAGTGVYDCWGEFHPEWTLQLYVTWFTVAIYIIPFVLLAVAYGRICYAVWRSMRGRETSKMERKSLNGIGGKSLTSRAGGSSRKQENGNLLAERRQDTSNPRAHVRGMSNAKVKTVKLTLTVIACYLLCWGPFFVSQMWAAWDPNAPFEATTFVIIMLLASLNSCTNPWVYLVFSDVFRLRSGRCCRKAEVRRSSASFDSESRMRTASTVYTNDVSRIDQSSFIMHDRK